jgi:hypothetical protein
MPDNESVQKQIKSKARVSAHGEVFTADREVNAMLNLVKEETERIESRFLEPACGNGNFLAKILERKLVVVRNRYAKNRTDWELYALIAVASSYGIEILQDNVAECRERLYNIFLKEYHSLFPEENINTADYLKSIRYVFERNILWGDALTLQTPDGAKPIIFSEWSAVNGSGLIKRRDFTMDNLLKNQPMEGPNLFSDLGDEAFVPTPIAEYPPIHYTKLYSHETDEL